MRKGLGQAESNLKERRFELEDILAVREHWKNMSFKKLVKEVLLTESEVRDIMAKYKLRGHDFSDTQLVKDLYRDFKGKYKLKYIRECVKLANTSDLENGQNELVKERKAISPREKIIADNKDHILAKITAYILVERCLTISGLAKETIVSVKILHNWKNGKVKITKENILRALDVFGISSDNLEGFMKQVDSWEHQELLGLTDGLRVDTEFNTFVISKVTEKYGQRYYKRLMKMERFKETKLELSTFRVRTKPLTIYNSEKARKLFQYSVDEWIELITEFRDVQSIDVCKDDVSLLIRYYKELYSEK